MAQRLGNIIANTRVMTIAFQGEIRISRFLTCRGVLRGCARIICKDWA
jgi:hypothetical protein